MRESAVIERPVLDRAHAGLVYGPDCRHSRVVFAILVLAATVTVLFAAAAIAGLLTHEFVGTVEHPSEERFVQGDDLSASAAVVAPALHVLVPVSELRAGSNSTTSRFVRSHGLKGHAAETAHSTVAGCFWPLPPTYLVNCSLLI